MTVFVSIGNSDDKLSQAEWVEFCHSVETLLLERSKTIHGNWYSSPTSKFQNACFCFELADENWMPVRDLLRSIARRFGQDAIAWTEAQTEFLSYEKEEIRHNPLAEECKYRGSGFMLGQRCLACENEKKWAGKNQILDEVADYVQAAELKEEEKR